MARKKLSEMTPYERVDSRMKGMSWEEAEDVGVEILARCIALHTFAREDIDEFVEPYVQILEKIKGTDSKDVEISEKDKKSLYEFCKNITEEEFEKMVEVAREISSEIVENLFDENTDSSGIDELIDVMKEEGRD